MSISYQSMNRKEIIDKVYQASAENRENDMIRISKCALYLYRYK